MKVTDECNRLYEEMIVEIDKVTSSFSIDKILPFHKKVEGYFERNQVCMQAVKSNDLIFDISPYRVSSEMLLLYTYTSGQATFEQHHKKNSKALKRYFYVAGKNLRQYKQDQVLVKLVKERSDDEDAILDAIMERSEIKDIFEDLEKNSPDMISVLKRKSVDYVPTKDQLLNYKTKVSAIAYEHFSWSNVSPVFRTLYLEMFTRQERLVMLAEYGVKRLTQSEEMTLLMMKAKKMKFKKKAESVMDKIHRKGLSAALAIPFE